MNTRHAVEPAEGTVVIVGGGIAGLYCARLLAPRFTCTVLEQGEDFGGRIETADLFGFQTDSDYLKERRVKAEFGPMRFELAIQPLFKELVDEFNLEIGPFT